MKFAGKIGFAVSRNEVPGVFTDEIVERDYVGDFLSSQQIWRGSSHLNEDPAQNNSRISIVSDPFASKNYSKIKYAKWGGVRWKVTRIKEQPPRLILTTGEVYNETSE